MLVCLSSVRLSVCSACCSLPRVARNLPIEDQARDKQRRDRPREVVISCLDPCTFVNGYIHIYLRESRGTFLFALLATRSDSITLDDRNAGCTFSTFPPKTLFNETTANCRVVSRASATSKWDSPRLRTTTVTLRYVTFRFISFFFFLGGGIFIKIYIGDTRASLRRI